MEVPHGIHTTIKTLKSWREFREKQRDFAQEITTPMQDLCWDTLARRRKTARLSFMYKLTHNLIDFSAENHLKPKNKRRTRGGHDFKFLVPRAKTDIFKFSFFHRKISEWNSLPKDIVNAASLDSFNSMFNQ